MREKEPLGRRLARLAQRAGVRTDQWHTDLPGVRSIEELDALGRPPERCPCCGYATLSARGVGERCGVCAWVDVAAGDDAMRANDGLTLDEAKASFEQIGACHEKYFLKTRSPRFKEMQLEEAVEEAPGDEVGDEEIASQENVDLVSSIYDRVESALDGGTMVSPAERVVHGVEYLSLEANSGASFEQYFRWADREQVLAVVHRLRNAGLGEVAEIAQRAFEVAFPDGYPENDDEVEEAIAWSDQQLEEMETLFQRFEALNGHITNRLAEYAREHGAS
jgi:hypothetical protein